LFKGKTGKKEEINHRK